MANVGDTVRALQAQIDIIARFCVRTNMKINLQKTKVIVFQNGGILRHMRNGILKELLLKLYLLTNILVYSQLKHNVNVTFAKCPKMVRLDLTF